MSTFPSDGIVVEGLYFDGRSARAQPVTLTIVDGCLLLRGEEVVRKESVHTVRVSEPMGAAPRLVSFADGAHCEVRDPAFAGLLRDTGHRDHWIVRLQSYWRAALASIVLTLAALTGTYVWGLPALAGWMAVNTPQALVSRLGSGSMEFLDQTVFDPSTLQTVRQAQLREQFDALQKPSGAPAYRIEFRASEAMGANAFALPDGMMVLTDDLVKLANNVEEILAVLAHELGHVHNRHGLRMLIQSSVVAFVVAWYLGDVSSIAAGLPTLLLQARYSRGHELEADRYGAVLLKANGISPARLADMLQALETDRERRKAEQAGKTGTPAQAKDSTSSHRVSTGYLDSHPDTAERTQRLRSGYNESH